MQGGGGGGGGANYRNPCLTMHQPWASLLVHGIKRIEGRSWPAPITGTSRFFSLLVCLLVLRLELKVDTYFFFFFLFEGRLWIHAASKVPDPKTIKAMEDFYKEIYAVNGITDIKFPEHYPVSRVLGCVEVVGCLKCEELMCWEAVAESKLTVPFEMRGYQRVYNLEKRIYDAAVRGFRPVYGTQPVKFPLPDPRDPSSLRPGSFASSISSTRLCAVEKPPSMNAAIEGARAAATQFSKKDQMKFTIENQTDIVQNDSEGTSHNVSTEENRKLSHFPDCRLHRDDPGPKHLDQQACPESRGSGRRHSIVAGRGFNPQSEVPSSKQP